MSTDSIEREVTIEAPVERVWSLITEAEHLGAWFGDDGATIDLRPGGEIEFAWREHGNAFGTVVAVEPPRRFAYRWHYARETRDETTPGNSTLVEFTLAAEGEQTRVGVIETGFDSLDLEAAERAERLAGNTRGWAQELAELAEHAVAVTTA